MRRQLHKLAWLSFGDAKNKQAFRAILMVTLYLFTHLDLWVPEHEHYSEVPAHPVCVYVHVSRSSADMGLDAIDAL